MSCIYQISWFSKVMRVQPEELLAESTIIGTDAEASGRLLTDAANFEIKEASWEVIRSPGGVLDGRGVVPGLKGVAAYFNAGKELRRAVGEEAGGLARELFAECIRGMIQAETFLYQERGYPTAEAYGGYWEKLYLNSCRYYSSLDRISRRWSDYVSGYSTGSTFFNRVKSCSIYKKRDGLTTAGILTDSFHEMSAIIDFNAEGTVTGCSGNFLRAPDQVCFENSSLLDGLIGAPLIGFGKKDIAKIIGGPLGCDHLVDLVGDMVKSINTVFKNNSNVLEEGL